MYLKYRLLWRLRWEIYHSQAFKISLSIIVRPCLQNREKWYL